MTKRVIDPAIGKIVRVLEILRAHHQEINTNAVLAYLRIATDPGVTVGEVQDYLGMPSGSVARAVALLSKHHRGGQDGLDLIRYETDIIDRRVKHLHLTPKGVRVWNQIREVLGL